MLGGIGESLKYLLSVIYLIESAGGARYDTLTAVDTGAITKVGVERASDMSIESTVISADNTDSLNLLTYCRASAAEDTLAGVTDDSCRGGIKMLLGLIACEIFLVYLVLTAELLKLTGRGAYAGEALSVMVRKKKLEVHLSRSHNSRRIGNDLHAVTVYGIYASGNETSCSLYLYKAETASTDLVDILEVAKGGNIDICHFSGFKDGDALGNGIIFAVYFNIYSFHLHSFLS
jgi:hypothetical protein